VEKEEVRAGRAKRQIERVSNTILTDLLFFRGRELEGGAWVLLVDLPECGVGRLAAAESESSVRGYVMTSGRAMGRKE
jgi:hypothetical protein